MGLIKELVNKIGVDTFERVIEYFKEIISKREIVKQVKACLKEYDGIIEEGILKKLKEFILDRLFNDMLACFILPDRKLRGIVKNEFYNEAFKYSGAVSINQQNSAGFLIKKIFDIVQYALIEKSGEELLPFNKLEDEISNLIDKLEGNLKAGLNSAMDKLVEKIDYKDSFAEFIDNIPFPEPNNTLFHFKNDSIKFYGREKQIEYLDVFLDDNSPLLFTAITGNAGAGKSKFIYEYAKRLSCNLLWKPVFFSPWHLSYIHKKHPINFSYSSNLLIIIDYAGYNSKIIGELLNAFNLSEKSKKVRIVLLEREGFAKSGLQQQPLWYERLVDAVGSGNLKSILYKNSFIELPPLSENDLSSILHDFAKSKRKTLNKEQINAIIDYAIKIEKAENAVRPLILLFVADAFLENNDYKKWNLNALLENIIKKYKKHWEMSLCNGKTNNFKALEKLIVYATATENWEIKNALPTPFHSSFEDLKNNFDADKLKELLRGVNEKQSWDGTLSKLEPDLIGEFLVLEHIRTSHNKKELVIAFSENSRYFSFLSRAVQDYAAEQRFNDLFVNAMEALLPDEVIADKCKDKDFAFKYAISLASLSLEQDLEGSLNTVGKLKELLDKYDKKNIALCYAIGLFSLSLEQDLEGSLNTVNKLKELFEKYGDKEFAFEYASGLSNLSFKQDLEGCLNNTVNKLKELFEKYGDKDFALFYVMGLSKLLLKQDLERRINTADKIKELSDKYNDGNIKSIYKRCLSVLG